MSDRTIQQLVRESFIHTTREEREGWLRSLSRSELLTFKVFVDGAITYLGLLREDACLSRKLYGALFP